jgi:hypothetical protein
MENNENQNILKNWKKRTNRTWKHKLPSGLDVILRRPAWMNLLKIGLIPNRLFNLVMGEQKPNVDKETGQIDYRETISIMQAYAIGACITPRIVTENPNDDEISVDQIEDADLISIWSKVNELLSAGEEGEGKSLENFRNERNRTNSGSDSDSLSSKTIQPIGHK